MDPRDGQIAWVVFCPSARERVLRLHTEGRRLLHLRVWRSAVTIVPVDPHGQLGTGAWGPFLGIHYRFEQVNWLGFVDFAYRMRTTGSYFDGSKCKFGDAALWSVHGQYRPINTLAVDVGIDGRYARLDKASEAGETSTISVDNTGGLVLSAAPGLYFNAVAALWVFARAQIPFYKNLYGEQDVKPSAAFGLQYQVL